MKTVPVDMQAELDGRATHHCFCWQVTRTDGQSFGFTDHDNSLEFMDTTFSAETGLVPSALESSTGLNVDNMDVMGILNSISIDENDLAAGLYDNATITAYRVDWRTVENRIIMLRGSIGNVSRGNMGFQAEIRGLAHEMNQKTGRAYEPTCDTTIGSSLCKIDLDGVNHEGHAYRVTSAITSVLAQNTFQINTSDITDLPDNWFTRGLITWTSGNNTGAQVEIKVHSLAGSIATFVIWEIMAYPIQTGDTLNLRVGCDRSSATCYEKFRNMDNFRGFNLIPGNDIVLRAVTSSEDNSGGSIF